MDFFGEYSEKALEHFENPRNVGIVKELNGYGKIGDPACGDVCEITVHIEHSIIKDIKFRAYGCAGVIATTSAVTEMARGKDIDYALNLSDDDVIEFLGGLPDNKKHCSLLGIKALREAINNHRSSYGPNLRRNPKF